MVFDSALVDVIDPVANPVPSVVEDGWVSVLAVPVEPRTTVDPAMGFPWLSRAVTEMVDPVPPALIPPGRAVTVESEAETAPAVMLNALDRVRVSPKAVA